MFFVTSDHIPEGVGFQAFGLTHIIWLLAGLILCIAACIFYGKLSTEKRKRMLTVLGAYIFLQEMVKNLVLILLEEIPNGHFGPVGEDQGQCRSGDGKIVKKTSHNFCLLDGIKGNQ